MLVNAMWYNTVPEQPATSAISLGPFNLNPAQIGVGVMSNLIVFPPSFLIVFFFKKSRPRVLRKSRIEEALKEASKQPNNKNKENENKSSENEKNERERENVTETQANANSLAKTKKMKKKKRKISLPWWCKIVAWILVVICFVAGAFFLLMYGITFGNEKATKWLTALFISFFSSVLFVQPIKVFLTAMFMSLICKNVDLDVDDADDDEEKPNLESDELWLYEGEKSTRLGYRRVDKEALEELRRRRLKELEMWDIILEFVAYAFFIWVLLVISYGQRDPSSIFLTTSLKKAFLNPNARDATNFLLINTKDDLWFYLENGLMGELRADVMYNGQQPYQLRGYLNDYSNRIMGYATIRQIRTKKNTCLIPPVMANVTGTCAGQSNLINEEDQNFCRGWVIPTTQSQNIPDCQIPEFRYETATQLQSLPLWGRSDWYGGGGYVIHMQGSTHDVLTKFQFLQENNWINDLTRAIIIEFSTYNSQVNLFSVCTLLVEQVSGGGLNPYASVQVVSLIEYQNNFGSFIIACEIIFILFTIYFTVHELRLLLKMKKKYFDSYWSYVELSMIFVCCCTIVTYIVRYIETNKVLKTFQETSGNGYMRMTYAVTVNETMDYCIAYLVFVGTLKFIKLLRFNKRMGMLASTLYQCANNMIGFAMSFAICLIAFVCFFYVTLMPYLADFDSFMASLYTCISISLGVFPFGEIANMSYIIIFMFFFIALITLLVYFNLLITIIISAFDEVRNDVVKQGNDYEMVDFVFTQFKGFIGQAAASSMNVPQKPLPPPPPTPDKDECAGSTVTELPDKVDKLMEYMNQVYFDGTLDLKSKGSMKQAFNLQKRNVYQAEDSHA